MSGTRKAWTNWEREVAKALREFYPEAARGLQSSQGRSKATTVPDVDGTPFWVECTKTEEPFTLRSLEKKLIAKMDQAEEDARSVDDSRRCLIFYRSHRQKLVAWAWDEAPFPQPQVWFKSLRFGDIEAVFMDEFLERLRDVQRDQDSLQGAGVHAGGGAHP